MTPTRCQNCDHKFYEHAIGGCRRRVDDGRGRKFVCPCSMSPGVIMDAKETKKGAMSK